LGIPIGNFKVYDKVEKKIIDGNIAITNYSNDYAVSMIKEELLQRNCCLIPIGRRERFIVIPEVPNTVGDEPLYVGDVLSNGIHPWVIKFDYKKGVYCTSIEFPNAFNRLDHLLKNGWKKIGDIFSNSELLGGKSVEVFLS